MHSSGQVAWPASAAGWRRMVLVLIAVTVAVGVAAGAAPMRLADAQDQVDPPDEVDDVLDDDDDDDGGGDDEPECGEALHYGHTTSVATNNEGSLNHLVVVDFNDDDHPDVAAAQKDGKARVWLNDGPDGDYAPSFTEAPHSPYAIGDQPRANNSPGLVAADFDGDGHPDLAATSSGGGAHGQGSVEVLVHSGDGAAPFSGEPTSYEVRPDDDNEDAVPRDLVAVEVTGDGAVDLAVLNHVPANPDVGVVVVMEGNGDGTFTEPDWEERTFVAQTDQRRMTAGDIDGDGDDDLVTVARRDGNDDDMVTAVENTDDGLEAVGSSVTPGMVPKGIMAGDVTADGLADVAVAHGTPQPQMSVLVANGGGEFADADGYDADNVTSKNGFGITAADMGGDHMDLVASIGGQGHDKNYLSSWVWLWTGDGDGGFTWTASCEIRPGHEDMHPDDVVTADFVGNGHATDVMVTYADELVVMHPPPGALRGRVIEEKDDPEGVDVVDEEMIEPVAEARVTAERVGGWFAWAPPVLKDALTDGEGFYPHEEPEDSPFGERWKPDEVVALVPGFYDVTADADGYRPEMRERVEVVSWNPDEDPTVEDFALAPWGEISGTVKDAASEDDLDGVAVTVTSLDDELSEGEPEVVGEATSEAGEFVVDEVDPDEYRVTGELDGYESDSAEAVVRDEPGYEATVELELEPKPGVITGQVTDAGDGDPIAGAQVAVTSNEGGSGPVEELTGDDGRDTETGADGRYEVAGLEPGEYGVAADADGYESAAVGPVEVEPGAPTEANLALAPLSDDDPPDDDDPDDGGGDGGGGDPGGEAGGDPGGESGGEAGGESAGETGGETGGESAGETGLEPSGDSAGESAGETGGEPGGETGGETGGEPAGDSVGEAGGEPAGDSAGEAGGEPAGDSAGEAGGDSGGESGGEVAAEPTVDAAGEPSIAQAPASEPAPAAAEAGAEPAAAEPAGDPAAMAPGESGVPGEAAAADQPHASGAGEPVRQVAPPVETEGVPAGEETGWLATATTSGQPPASAVRVWVAGVALAGVAGWGGRRRRAQPATPTCALARVPADPSAGPDGDDLDGHADVAWIVRGLR